MIKSGQIHSPANRPAPFIIQNTTEEEAVFPRVFLSIAAWQTLWNHAMTSTNREVGGVLIGDRYKDGKGTYIDIAVSLQAMHALEKRAAITFTHDTWNEINKELDAKWPDLKIIGWYHTHPGFGTFLSSDDQFIHRNFFSESYQIALVFDPIQKKIKLFRYEQDYFTDSNVLFIYINPQSEEQVTFLAKLCYPEEPLNRSQRFINKICRYRLGVLGQDRLAFSFNDLQNLGKDLFRD